MGQAAIPYVIAAVAAGVSANNEYQAAKRQDQAAAAGIAQQRQSQHEANVKVNQQLDQMEKSTANDERAASQEQFLTQLRRNRQSAEGSLPKIYGASDRYGADVTDRSAKSSAQAERIADLMSRINAPVLQRQHEGEGFGQLASELSQIGANSQGDDFLTRLRVNAIRKNPWVDLAATLGSNYAGYAAGQGGTTAAKTAGGMSSKPTVSLASQFAR